MNNAATTPKMVSTTVKTGKFQSSHLSISLPPKAQPTMITTICNASVEYLA